MSLKRKSRITEAFSMASMTDVIFLLLIFFLVTSTIIVPNALKVSLPSAERQVKSELPALGISLTEQLECFLSEGNAPATPITLEELEQRLGIYSAEHPEAFVSIHADERVPYQRVMELINIASRANLRVVLATKIISRT
ncbi:biopolymer transporter ExbD [Porphyromonas sp. COT-239 OH1446]|uniref:ExbD/TolR family protein n=1 Tax=Porphyromonas sp. COT-239 OH1446 TaxID=1515613 RepID=UPI00052B6A00|nr:biopolymer transporter ExbD [Porphyromonas sp. COT-239 OH1446]KGN71354.1 biopolymer transporter ExbD [Porphyromonas sp. COT-239 OH1446]